MKELKRALLIFITLVLLTGVLYPFVVTIIAKFFFPWKSEGSIVLGHDGTKIGSALIGQQFSDPKYFWSRPSSTGDFSYNPVASGGSNLGPTNASLINQIKGRISVYQKSGINDMLPADLVMSSSSGLDPHISLESAMVQVPRISFLRKISEKNLRDLVFKHLEGRFLDFIGSKRINVLELNFALDNSI